MSGIVGSKFNHRGSGLVGSLGTDGQHMLSSGAGKKHVFETIAAVSAYDDEPIKSDLTALAIREATNESSAAFNLPGSFIETFTDDTNLGTQTTVDRTSGYVSSVYSVTAAFSDDGNTDMLLHMDDTSLVDTAGNIGNPTLNNSVTRSATQSKFGGYSASLNGSNQSIHYPDHAKFNYATNDFTFEFWIRLNAVNTDYTVISGRQDDANRYHVYINGTSTQVQLLGFVSSSTVINCVAPYAFVADTWTHVAVARASGAVKIFVNGTSITLGTNTSPGGILNNGTGSMSIGNRQDGTGYVNGYIDEVRFSDNARYSSNFTPNTTTSDNATGTLVQSANSVTGTRTSVGGTMLYKDNAGTASIGTDLKIYFSADNSAWTEAASYTAITPVYSSGIKMVRLGKTTVTGGTDVRYKAVWANQSSGSKETQLHAIGINY